MIPCISTTILPIERRRCRVMARSRFLKEFTIKTGDPHVGWHEIKLGRAQWYRMPFETAYQLIVVIKNRPCNRFLGGFDSIRLVRHSRHPIGYSKLLHEVICVISGLRWLERCLDSNVTYVAAARNFDPICTTVAKWAVDACWHDPGAGTTGQS